MKKLLILWITICGVVLPCTLRAQEGETLVVQTQDRIDSFVRRMKDWGYYYGDLAGTQNLRLSYDDEVSEGHLLIEGGDWAVFDRRLCSGAYGVSHEDGSIFQIELTNPDGHDIDCLTPTITSQVDAITLMQRYQWFNALFIDWYHELTPSPLNVGGWDGFEDINASYDSEKPDLANDPHLALFWLMHFGFMLDPRYDEVKALVTTHNLATRLDVIDDALAFFDHQSPYEDIEITNSYFDDIDFAEIYLKRRAFLVYITRSYDYASGEDGLDAWWHSINLYPKSERYAIRRMRWLGNNLRKFDQWQSFADLLGLEHAPDDISLLSYVRALNPLVSETDQQEQATRFLDELIANEQLWKNPTERRFGQVMIWDVRELIVDTSLLQAATDIYFSDDTISDEFQAINAILNGADANDNIAKIREAVILLEDAGDQFDRFDAGDAQRQTFWQTIDDTLDQARATSDDTLFEVIANLDNEEVQKRALRYVYTQDIPEKTQAFVDLFIRLEPGSYDMPDIFEGVFPQMFNGPGDPNIALARQLLFVPEMDHRNDWAAENSREAATMFFLGTVHWPENFDFFMALLADPKLNDLTNLKEDVLSNLLAQEYDTSINSTHQMSQDQLNTMLDTISGMLRQRGWHEHGFSQEAIRAIYYMDNPLAKDWMEDKLDNRKWLATFPNVDMDFDPLRVEINDAIESSLEFIEERTAE